jgi:hypothetical protein
MTLMSGALLAVARVAATRGHPFWHYLVIPAIGAVLLACITVPDFIRGITQRRAESSGAQPPSRDSCR